jgi:glutaredoxin
MKSPLLLTLVLALTPILATAAQLYRWVDEKGNIEWRDTPPPPNAKKVEQRNLGANTIETSTLPYSVQQAVKKFPVTLWAFDCGDPCNRARAHLQKRGVPHVERNAQKEPDALKSVTGTLEVPVLLVGSKQLKGYLESDWDAALDSAGYPKTPPPGVKPKAQQPASGKSETSAPAPDAAPNPAAQTR